MVTLLKFNSPLHARFVVHGPSRAAFHEFSVLIVRKRNLPGGTRSINQTSSRVRIGVRGLFVPRLFITFASIHLPPPPPPHVTVNATVHTFTLSRARAKARHSYSYVTLYTDRKEEKGERSRDLTLFTLEGL